MAFLVTCEHASRSVPTRWQRLFRGAAGTLASHRGWDPSALAAAQALARELGASLIASRWTRLLVDTNRSLHHPSLFSAWTKPLPADERQRILAHAYHPYRARVEEQIEQLIRRHGRVVHLSMHSFVPVLNAEVRRADVGLLYDPARKSERELCGDLRRKLQRASPGLRLRRNYPYRGVADGLTTHLRQQHGDRRYAGIEVELNQATFSEPRIINRWVRELASALSSSAPAIRRR